MTIDRCAELRPRPLFCIISNAHADIENARAVCRGLFHEAGQTVAMPMPPCWATGALPDDPEWRIAWHKFYFGLDLSHAYAVTGDQQFLAVWKQLVLSFIEQLPARSESDIHVVARRALNWIYAWIRFSSVDGFPGLGVEESNAIATYLGEEAAHIRRNLSPGRNHRTIELTALLHLAIALPLLDPAGDLLDFTIRRLNANLHEDILGDGSHVESSTHYHMISLRNFLACRVNAQLHSVRFPPEFDQRLELACNFAMHAHRPDGSIATFSDSDSGSYLDLLLLAADLFQREDLRFVGARGAAGRVPDRNSASFPEGGYHVQRSSWDVSARYLMFDCGPPGAGGHVHYDALHFEMSAYGQTLIVDPGRYTYSDVPARWRRWFKSTAAHNTVCVDGKDQTPYQCWDRSSGSASPQAAAEMHDRWTAPGLEVVRASVRSPCYSAHHQRRIIFAGGEYWLIEDVLTDQSNHRYDLRFHLSSSAEGRVSIREEDGCATVTAPGLILICLGGSSVQLEEGWVSPSYGVKLPAPVVSIRQSGTAVRFLSVLLPISQSNRDSKVLVSRPNRVELEFQIDDERIRDLLLWTDEETELEAGPFRLPARIAWLRRDSSRQDASGELRRFAAAGLQGYSYWDWEQKKLVRCSGGLLDPSKPVTPYY